MSRFSPQVQERETPDIGAMITQAFMAHRQQKKQDADDAFTEEARARARTGWQQADEDRSQNEAIEAAERYDAGFRTRDQVDTTTDAPGMHGVAVRGLDGAPLERPADRYQRFGDVYRDPDATPEGIRRQRNRQAYEALDPASRGAYAEGADYLGQIGEQFKFNRDVRLEDHKTDNDLKVEGVQQTGRKELAGINNGASMARVQVQESGANTRHNTPGAGSNRPGPGGLTRDQALDQARALSTYKDEQGNETYSRDEPGMIDLADQLFNGTYKAPAPAPAATTAAPAPTKPAGPGRGTQLLRGLGNFIQSFSPDAIHPIQGAQPRGAGRDPGGDIDLNTDRGGSVPLGGRTPRGGGAPRGGSVPLGGSAPRGAGRAPTDAEVAEFAKVLTDEELREEGVPEEQIRRVRRGTT